MNRKGLGQIAMCGKESGLENWGLNKEMGKDPKFLFNKQKNYCNKYFQAMGWNPRFLDRIRKYLKKALEKYQFPSLLALIQAKTDSL